MAYLTREQLETVGFKKLGKNIKVSDKASIYNPELIELGDYSRIDDFCVISGKINIGRFVHVAPQCLLAGGEEGILWMIFLVLLIKFKFLLSLMTIPEEH